MFTQSQWFLQGLLFTIQTEIFSYYKLNPDDNQHIDFADLLKKALGLLGAKKMLVELVCTDKKSDCIEDLVKKYKTKSQISFAINYSTSLPESAFQPPVTTFRNTMYSNAANRWPMHKKID